MAKRIFELAKELGIESKAIITKCVAEGIPSDKVKNHMATVTPGLEASIREWFSGESSVATAVEASPKVDLERAKHPPTVRRARPGSHDHKTDHKHDVETGENLEAKPPHAGDQDPHVHRVDPAAQEVTGAATATVPLPSKQGTPPATHAAPTHAPAPTRIPAPPPAVVAPPAGAVTTIPAQRATPTPTQVPTTRVPSAPGPVVTRPAAATTEAAPEARSGREPGESTRASQMPTSRPGADRAATPTNDRPPNDASRGPAQGPGAGGAAVQTPAQGPTREGPGSTGQGPLGPRQGGPQGPGRSGQTGGGAVSPNVPRRPAVVSPAGPKLGQVTPVKLSGPKVVRIEAPEQVEAPRPRRAPGYGPGSGSSGGAAGAGARPPRFAPGGGPAPTGDTEEERKGAQRRGVKNTGGGAAGGKRSGVAGNRRAFSGQEWTGPGVFSEQDMLEREQRLARSGGTIKKHKQDLRKGPGQQGRAEVGPTEGPIRVAAPFTIKDLSAATGVKGADIVKRLFLQGVMATINSGIDPAKAQEIMLDFDIEIEVVEAKTAEQTVSDAFVNRATVDKRPRGPVVTILGHVDHGKTSLLDKIRNANVAAGEAGGITQRTSAFRVQIQVAGEKKEVVFLDTPGHEAFTSMRARGANMTDVVVLVVSAPEGVMPQTIESINHAKAAKVPIVVALNKIDRPDATEAAIQKTLGQLADAGLNPVEWGGDAEIVRTSAVTGKGIPELLEVLDYQAQLRELTADFGGSAAGTVIEARTEEGRGAVANLLVQHGRLKVGDFIVAGRGFGRVRDITDDRGNRLKETEPPMPVQISGIDEVPDAGDKFFVVESLKQAQDAAEQRRRREREAQLAQPKVTLDSLFTQIGNKDVKEILIVLKAAEQGTVDVLRHECEKIQTSEVKTRVLHAGIGGITESDVVLADASKAVIIGFNVIPSGKARTLAEQKGVEIRTYQVIYDITEDLKKAAEGLLAPELRQEILGHAEVRAVFRITKVGSIAGCYVTDGTVQRDALIRVTRNGIVIENDRRLEQLKRVKDDVREVRAGLECGMKIVGYDDIKEGDVLECYKQVEIKRTL